MTGDGDPYCINWDGQTDSSEYALYLLGNNKLDILKKPLGTIGV